MGTFVVGIIVALIALLACFSIYKDKKRGKCCGGCSGRAGGCLKRSTDKETFIK